MEVTETDPPATPEQGKLVRAYALGGPLKRRMIEAPVPWHRRLVVATGPTGNTSYYYRAFKGGGWRVAIPMWVHESLINKDGQVISPAFYLPPYMAAPMESCLLLPRVRK